MNKDPACKHKPKFFAFLLSSRQDKFFKCKGCGCDIRLTRKARIGSTWILKVVFPLLFGLFLILSLFYKMFGLSQAILILACGFIVFHIITTLIYVCSEFVCKENDK